MSPETADFIPAQAAPIFAALGDSTRLSLLSRLSIDTPRSIIQITKGTGLTRQGVSKQLRILEDVGMVSREKVGRESQYLLKPAGLNKAKSYIDRASKQWDDNLLRLKRHVED